MKNIFDRAFNKLITKVFAARVRTDSIIATLISPIRIYQESQRFNELETDFSIQFFVVSCGRNSGESVIKCLQSVYDQEIDRHRVKHLMVDDASDDGTAQMISNWLDNHPDHNVKLIQNEKRKGGTANTLDSFRKAPESAILLELNADDWLPDGKVMGYLAKIYSDPDVWMTYNSYKYSDQSPCERGRPYPSYVVRKNLYRDYEWICQHLHSFRTELLGYLPDDVFIDPENGEYFSCADDRSIYWSLLELCGHHAVHLYRTTYIYHFHENTDMKVNPIDSLGNVDKIRNMPRLNRLENL